MDDVFSTNDQPIFLHGEGQLSEEDVLFLAEESGLGTVKGAAGEISTNLRAKSYFSIGEPIVLPLAQLLTERGEAISADIRLQMQHYDFYQIQLACSFQPAPSCRFHDARFALTLQTVPVDTNGITQLVPGKAIAYDLFPLRIEDEYKVTIKRSFNPEIKFNFDPVTASLALPLYDRTEEYITYTSRIEAFDLQGAQPAWSFTRTVTHEIGGPQKLFMVIRKPKGTQVEATYRLTARVQFMIGTIALDPYPLIMFFRRRDPQSVISDVPTIPLC